MTVQLTQQMGTHSRDWGNRSGAWIGYALAPAETQDGDHVVSVGVHVQRMGRLARLLTSSLNWPGRFANRRSGLFHSIARIGPPRRLSDRQRAGANPLGYRLSAAFNSCRAIRSGCGTLSRAFQHFVRQDLYVPESHVVNASLVRWFNANRHSERYLEPCSLNQGKRLPQ